MQFLSLASITALCLATGSQAWAKDGNGVWTANNNHYTIRGIYVAEACTKMGRDDIILKGEKCAYWLDGAGNVKRGKCKQSGGPGGPINCE